MSDNELDLSELENARFVFWTCPNGCQSFVSWSNDHSVAMCDKCGAVSNRQRALLCVNALAGISTERLEQLAPGELGKTLHEVAREMNAIRARDGSPAVYHASLDGSVMVTHDPAPEYWDELTERAIKLSKLLEQP